VRGVGHGREAREHQGELADLEDLADQRSQRGDDDRPALRPDLPEREHENAKPDAGDVVDRAQVEHEGPARAGLSQVRPERRLERLGAGVVDAPSGAQDEGVAVAGAQELHGSVGRRRHGHSVGAA
jgi:hypothetical protein